MNIVHAASEVYPFARTGGLADATGALMEQLAELGHEVSVFMPGYRAALEHPAAAKAERVHRLQIELRDQFLQADVRRLRLRDNLHLYFICREEFFDRRLPYGNGERDYDDNAERFIFFCKGVVETMRLSDLQADVVHAHDWPTALLPLLVRFAERRHQATLAFKTVFTVHNTVFQGIFPMSAFGLTNLPEELLGIDGLEYYGQINLLKGGILFADRVTTVSPTYAREIQDPEFGAGLDGVFATRAADLVGLLYGIDDAVWNPAADAHLPAAFSADRLEGKARCRAALLEEFGLNPAPAGPVYALVSRLIEQKGIDLLLRNGGFFAGEDVRLVAVGSGEAHYEDALASLARQLPGRVAFRRGGEDGPMHRAIAGADFLVMPSVSEPCGLTQMFAQRYGTLPLASRVGGLVDTVVDLDARPAEGTGLLYPPHPDGLAKALRRSLDVFRDEARRERAVRRAMARDFSWRSAARAYEALYQDSI